VGSFGRLRGELSGSRGKIALRGQSTRWDPVCQLRFAPWTACIRDPIGSPALRRRDGEDSAVLGLSAWKGGRSGRRTRSAGSLTT